jgi:hypothetical protein
MDTVDSLFQTPLTPEQLSAVAAGGGRARLRDPNTQRIYVLAEQCEEPVNDEYVRQKIDEAYEDAKRSGGFQPLDFDGLKAELNRRLEAKKAHG